MLEYPASTPDYHNQSAVRGQSSARSELGSLDLIQCLGNAAELDKNQPRSVESDGYESFNTRPKL